MTLEYQNNHTFCSDDDQCVSKCCMKKECVAISECQSSDHFFYYVILPIIIVCIILLIGISICIIVKVKNKKKKKKRKIFTAYRKKVRTKNQFLLYAEVDKKKKREKKQKQRDQGEDTNITSTELQITSENICNTTAPPEFHYHGLSIYKNIRPTPSSKSPQKSIASIMSRSYKTFTPNSQEPIVPHKALESKDSSFAISVQKMFVISGETKSSIPKDEESFEDNSFY